MMTNINTTYPNLLIDTASYIIGLEARGFMAEAQAIRSLIERVEEVKARIVALENFDSADALAANRSVQILDELYQAALARIAALSWLLNYGTKDAT